MHKFQNFKCGCLKQRKPIHFWVACTLPPTIVNSSLTHHFFLISSFLFLLTKKRKNNFFLKSSNIQEGNLTMIKICFFKQYYSEIWEVVYTLVCVYVCMYRYVWMSMLVHIWRPSALFSWDRDRASHWTWSEAGEKS